ncbi:MAG: AAA family ATPase, partial [Bacteroidales bacterium]|nr:AAA family ATPase [Bacteroidales bacterium]
GARQVGKTTLVREFQKEFDNYIELNLERDADRDLFKIDDIDKILNAAYLLKGIVPSEKPTLLFIDEIQESPKAIQLLRYFYEEKPEIYVIAAGSLLEFALKEVPSFPVGRIEYQYLHPLNFEEYLTGINHEGAINALKTIPVPDYAHKILLDLFHDYAIIGGMPEIVSQYVENKSIAALTKSYNRIWQSYKDDVEKYARNNTDRNVIRHVIETAPNEPDRIKFGKFGNSNYKSREVGEALRSLDSAKIIRLIYPSTNLKPPINTNLKKSPRLQFLDTGMLNQILLLQGELIGVRDLNNFHRGRIIQQLVSQELISIHDEIPYKPHFWVREEKDSNAEVDLVFRYGKYIIPIEIKSGKQGKLRSLHQFVERTNHPYAVRMHANEFSIEKVKTPGKVPYLLMNFPYYLATKIPLYLDYFVKNFSL